MSIRPEDRGNPAIMAQRGLEQIMHIEGVTFVTFDPNTQRYTIYVEHASVNVPSSLLGYPADKAISGPVSLHE